MCHSFQLGHKGWGKEKWNHWIITGSHQHEIDNKQSQVDEVELNRDQILVCVDGSGFSNRSTEPFPSTMKLMDLWRSSCTKSHNSVKDECSLQMGKRRNGKPVWEAILENVSRTAERVIAELGILGSILGDGIKLPSRSTDQDNAFILLVLFIGN